MNWYVCHQYEANNLSVMWVLTQLVFEAWKEEMQTM